MDRRVLSIVLLTLAGVVGACGGDDDDDKEGNTAGSVAKNTDVVCPGSGTKPCELPEGVDGKLCCTDPFNGKCGVKSGSGDSCVAFPENVDTRCPVPMIGGMGMAATMGNGFFYGCCADDGECGIGIASMPCQSVRSLCSLLPKALISQIQPQTCDGETVELPADCGTNTTFTFPGRGGAGTGTSTGAGGMSGGGGS